MKRFSTVVLSGVLLVAVPALASAQFDRRVDRQRCQAELEHLLMNKRVTAKVSFPASADGIDLTLDGDWDAKETSRRIKHSGGGIDIDEPATVTQVKLKDGLLEVQLNGGGFGTFGDFMTSSEKQRQERSTQGKASGGSRINLRFNRLVSCQELADPAAMIALLDPLVKADSLKMAAAQKAIPPEFADAAARKQVVAGMDKATVFAILGEPKQKQVDLAAEPPTEKWQYELPDLKTRVITFKAGKVTKVDEF
jgi:hypothetical protein